VVPHRAGRPRLPGFRDGDRQDALDEDRQRDAEEPGAERVRLHESAGAVRAAATPGAIAVRIKFTTSSDMPRSIETPESVRTSQNGFIVTTESTHSTPDISMKPCCNPCAARTRPMVEMPTVMSQKLQFPSRKLQS